jgi:hypothetical protein
LSLYLAVVKVFIEVFAHGFVGELVFISRHHSIDGVPQAHNNL